MQFKTVQAADKSTAQRLWSYCFENNKPFDKWYFSSYYQAENTFGVYEKEKLLAYLQLIPYDVFCRQEKIKASYLVGLASFPEVRGKRVIRKLLQASLLEMRKRKQALSILMPFRAEFYYPYQWELCYYHYQYKIPLLDLKKIAKVWGDFSRVQDKKSIEKLNQIYQNFVQDKHGYVVRTKSNWQRLIEEVATEEGFIYLLEHGGKPEGYLVYYVKNGKIILREMAYNSFHAQQSLLGFVYNHRSQVEFLEWNAALDDCIHYLLPNPQKEVQLYPFLAGRIIDLSLLFSTIKYNETLQEKIILAVEDKLADWNNQTFSLQVTDGKGKVIIVSERNYDVRTSIGVLSQLILGAVSAKQLAKMGKIKAKQDKIEILDRLFPLCNNYINEYF